MSDWLDILRGQTSIDDASSLLSEGAAQLDALIKSEPSTEQRVLGILHRHVGGPKGTDTWETLMSGLKYYVGEDWTYMLAWLVQGGGTTEKLAKLREHASPAVMSFWGTIFGIYGADLERAFDVWNQLPSNWSSISREVFFDQLSQVHRIVFRVKKFSGEEMAVEGPPNSMLSLTTHLLMTVRLIGQRDVLSELVTDEFLGEAAELVTFLGKKDRLIELLTIPDSEQPSEGPGDEIKS